MTLGVPLELSGRVLEAGAPISGTSLALQAASYPYRRWATIATATSGQDGGFTFAAIAATLDTHLRVSTTSGAPATSLVLEATVDPAIALAATDLGPGRSRLSARIAHTRQLSSMPVSAYWYTAADGSPNFHLAAVTSTRELPGGVTYASATIDPPARRFRYRLCINATWERAMGSRASHGRCPQHDYTAPATAGLSPYEAEARGKPLGAFPSRAAISRAARFLDSRAGRTSFAVVDNEGHESGLRTRSHFQSASVVKVMMLVAYLQMLEAHHRNLNASDNALLYPMIHISDNQAASAVLSIVGGAALQRVAREAGMQDYAPGVGWWAFTQTSAADQARFFDMLDRLIPARFYAYARGLMSTIEPEQSWGIPPVARPRWQVFFKTGALPSEGLFNEVARLERPEATITIAVFTTGDPSMAYGEETIQGVGRILLAGTPR